MIARKMPLVSGDTARISLSRDSARSVGASSSDFHDACHITPVRSCNSTVSDELLDRGERRGHQRRASRDPELRARVRSKLTADGDDETTGEIECSRDAAGHRVRILEHRRSRITRAAVHAAVRRLVTRRRPRAQLQPLLLDPRREIAVRDVHAVRAVERRRATGLLRVLRAVARSSSGRKTPRATSRPAIRAPAAGTSRSCRESRLPDNRNRVQRTSWPVRRSPPARVRAAACDSGSSTRSPARHSTRSA